MSPFTDPTSNRLLAALPVAEWLRWLPRLEAVDLTLGQVLCESERAPTHAYFPKTAIVSPLYITEDGASSEIAAVGTEGMVGTALRHPQSQTPIDPIYKERTMHALSKYAVALAALALAASASAQVTFYENESFQGRSFNTSRTVPDFQRFGFNDRASSVVVTSNRWEVCQDVSFKGRCVVLRQGQYPSLAAMGLNDRVSSVRTVGRNARVGDERYAPPPVVDRDYRRRNNERLFEAPVTSVRAVVGTPEQRCWVEREQVSQDRSDSRVPSAILGAVIGGILGHQIGGGSGRDIATAGGAVAGAAVGANIARDRDGRQIVTRNVQRCTSVPSQARPYYWDVSYTFRGKEYRVQMTAPPGPTVTVNRLGEPRG